MGDVESPILRAIRNSNPMLVSELIRQGADINERFGEYEETLLHAAVSENQYATVQLLLIENIQLIDLPDSRGRTPLMIGLVL